MKGHFSLPSPAELAPNSRSRVLALCAVVAAIVFGLDLVAPLGVAEAVPYVAVVLISLWSPQNRDPVWIAAGCTFLTVVGLALSPPGSSALWVAFLNRALALFAIWATALLAMRVRESDASVQAKSQLLTGILSNMPAVVFRMDGQGYMTNSMGKGLQRIGLRHLEVAGRTGLEPPPEVRARLGQMAPGEVLFYESHGSHRGSQWWFLIALTSDTVSGEGTIGFGIDITERKRAERRLAAHHAVTAVLAQAVSPEEALPRLVHAICEGLGWEMGAMWKLDQRQGVLRCIGLWHVPTVDVRDFEARSLALSYSRGVGFPGRVWEAGEPVWVEDVVEDTKFLRAEDAAKGGLHAGFGFPIKIDSDVWGVLEFFSREIEEPDKDLLEMFAALGIQIGHFLERQSAERRLTAHHAVTRVLAEAESLEQVLPHLLRAICQSLNFETGAIWTLDAGGQALRCAHLWHGPAADVSAFEQRSRTITFPRGEGLPGRVWASGRPAWIEDVVEASNFPRAEAAAKGGLHAGFAVPILIGDEFWGVMEFFSKEIKERDEDLLTMFTALGSQIGQFIKHKEASR